MPCHIPGAAAKLPHNQVKTPAYSPQPRIRSSLFIQLFFPALFARSPARKIHHIPDRSSTRLQRFCGFSKLVRKHLGTFPADTSPAPNAAHRANTAETAHWPPRNFPAGNSTPTPLTVRRHPGRQLLSLIQKKQTTKCLAAPRPQFLRAWRYPRFDTRPPCSRIRCQHFETLAPRVQTSLCSAAWPFANHAFA